jgi:hypothetical protein
MTQGQYRVVWVQNGDKGLPGWNGLTSIEIWRGDEMLLDTSCGESRYYDQLRSVIEGAREYEGGVDPYREYVPTDEALINAFLEHYGLVSGEEGAE